MCAQMTPALWTLSIAADKLPDCTLLVTCAGELASVGLSLSHELSLDDDAKGSSCVCFSFSGLKVCFAESDSGFFVVVAQSKRS
jgi:hypothetical protein